jgi:hypothetical protein
MPCQESAHDLTVCVARVVSRVRGEKMHRIGGEGRAMKLADAAVFVLALLITSGAAKAHCVCRCIDGEVQALC